MFASIHVDLTVSLLSVFLVSILAIPVIAMIVGAPTVKRKRRPARQPVLEPISGLEPIEQTAIRSMNVEVSRVHHEPNHVASRNRRRCPHGRKARPHRRRQVA